MSQIFNLYYMYVGPTSGGFKAHTLLSHYFHSQAHFHYSYKIVAYLAATSKLHRPEVVSPGTLPEL